MNYARFQGYNKTQTGVAYWQWADSYITNHNPEFKRFSDKEPSVA